MANIESIRVQIQVDTGPLESALEGINRSIARFSAKLDEGFDALDIRLGRLGKTLGDFRSETDGAANAVGRLLEVLGRLSGVGLLEGAGEMLQVLPSGPSRSRSRFGDLFAREPAQLLAEFKKLEKEVTLLKRDSAAATQLRTKQKALLDVLAGQTADVKAELDRFVLLGSKVPEELRETLEQLVQALQEIRATTSDPRFKSIIERFRFEPTSSSDQTGALETPSLRQLASFSTGSRAAGVGEDLAAFAELSDGFARATADSETLTQAQRDLAKTTRDLGFTFASAFEDAVVGGERLSEVLKGLEQDILRILTRRLVTEPLADAVTGAVRGGQGLLGDLFAGAPSLQGGGIVGLVPRLAPNEVPAILHRGETVRTPTQEAALARRLDRGGGDTPIVVNIQTPDPASFGASRGQIEAMLADAVRRGRRNR